MPNRGPLLRPYQARTLRALIAGIEACPAETFTVLFPRQAGKNEVSAALVAYLLRANAAHGGSIVVCAPTRMPQALISLERTMAALDQTRHLFPLPAVRREGTIECGASRAIFLSASPEAHVAGHTASLALIADEAQDIDADWFNRQFRPMAASTGAPAVMFGTPWDGRSLLETAVRANRARDQRRGLPVRLHHEVSWREVARYLPRYGDYVRHERERLGANHPLFLTQYELRTVAEAGRMFAREQLDRLAGGHALLSGPVRGQRYAAGLDFGGDGVDADATVLTIGRVAPGKVEVVGVIAWRGAPFERVVDEVADVLQRWAPVATCVDATGLGGPLAAALEARTSVRIERTVFSAAVKSELGYRLLAAANTSALAIPRDPACAALWRELAACRASPTAGRGLRWGDDRGHDDHVVSLALCLQAAELVGPPRSARGRAR